MRKKQVLAGTVLNYAVLGMQILSSIIITPFIISRLGSGTYGIYRIVTSIVAYLGVLNFGFGNAAILFLVQIQAAADKAREKQFLSVIKLLNLLAACVAVVAGVVLYLVIPDVFAQSLTPQEIEATRGMFTILIASVIIGIFNDVYIAIVTAQERFIFLKGFDLIRCVLRIVLIFAVLSLHPSAIGLVVIDLSMSIFALLSNMAYCSRRLHTWPHYLLQAVKTADWAFYKPVIIYALFYFVNLITSQLLLNTAPIIIGMRLSSFAAAIYGAGSTISSGFYTLSLVIGNLMFPQIVRQVNAGADRQELTGIMVRIGRAQALVSMLLLTGFFACGRQFVSLWLDPAYDEAWMTSLLVMVGMLFNALASAGHLILRAMNRQTYYMCVYLFALLLNAIASYMVVPHYGIVGASVTTLISFVTAAIFFITPYLHKVIGIDMLQFAGRLFPAIAVPAALGAACYFVFQAIGLDTWFKLALAIAVYVLLYGMVAYLFMLNRMERGMIRNIAAKAMGRDI